LWMMLEGRATAAGSKLEQLQKLSQETPVVLDNDWLRTWTRVHWTIAKSSERLQE